MKKTITKQKIKNAKEKVVDGIKFRSRLEAYTYTQLKLAGIPCDYEKHKFTLLDKFTTTTDSYEPHNHKGKPVFDVLSPNIRAITYTPDFVGKKLHLKKGWIIEVKGFANDAFPNKWKYFKKYLVDNNYEVTVFLPKNQAQVLRCIEIIKTLKHR
jgi:hypothetical protein